MVAVAALGTWRHVEHHQTAWRGATVGMFAHVDAPANRLVRGRATTADGTGLTLDRGRVATKVERALVTPTAANLEALGEAWNAELVDDGHTVVGLHVEVLRTRFHPDEPAVSLEVLASYGFAADGGRADAGEPGGDG